MKEKLIELLKDRVYPLDAPDLADEILELFTKDKEQHTMSDYCRPEMKKSKFVWGKAIVAYMVFECPMCGEERVRPEHGDKWTCGCGTNYQTYGNGLEMW